MAQDQQQLMKVFGSLLAAKGGQEEGPDPQAEYYRQREKYEKRRMLSSIIAPIAGQFLGNLVAAPFREPVQDFLRTQKGRDLYGQWRDHDLNKTELDNTTSDITKYDGSRSEFFHKRASDYTHQQLVEALGEDWYKDSQGPEIDLSTGQPVRRSSPVRGIYQDVNDHIRRVAQIEEQEYLQGVEYYKAFPDQEEFLANVERYGPRSSNFGQALFRKLKRAFTGQSREDYIDQSILNITGVNAHIFEQKLNEKPDPDYWAMDVETLQEGIARSTGTITPEVLDPIIQEATERYWATPTGRARAFENKLAMSERESANQLYVMFRDGDMDNLQHNAYIGLWNERPEGGPLPSMLDLEARLWEDLGEFTKNLPSNDELRGGLLLNPDFSDYIHGTEDFPGLHRGQWALNYESTDSRHYNLPWQEGLNLDGNLSYYIQKGDLTSADRTAFFKQRDMALDELMNAGRLALPGVISEMKKERLEIPPITDSFTGAMHQRNLLLQTIKALTVDHIERVDMDIYGDQSMSVFRGFGPVILKNAINGNVFQGDSLKRIFSLASTQAEMDAEDPRSVMIQGLDGEDIYAPPPMRGDIADIAELREELAGLTPAEIRAKGEAIGRPDMSTIANMPTDSVANRVAIAETFAAHSDSVFRPGGFSSEGRVLTTIDMLNSLSPQHTNIQGTEALNYTMLPLYTPAVTAYQDKDPMILPMPETDGLFVKITPQIRLHSSLFLQDVVENAGGPFLQLEVGRYVEKQDDVSVQELANEFVLGRGSSLLEDASTEEPGQIFSSIGALSKGTNTEAREALQYDNLPLELKEHLAIMSTRYVSLINELRELDVPADNVLSGASILEGASKFVDASTGAYKGTGNEKRINEIKAGLDIIERSIGVPGLDKGGERPIMSDLLLEAYKDNIGASSEEEASFLSELSDVDMRFVEKVAEGAEALLGTERELYRTAEEKVAEGTEALLDTPLGPGSSILLREAPEYFGSAAAEAGGSLLSAARDIDVGAGIERITEVAGEGVEKAARVATEAGRSLLGGIETGVQAAQDVGTDIVQRMKTLPFPGAGVQDFMDILPSSFWQTETQQQRQSEAIVKLREEPSLLESFRGLLSGNTAQAAIPKDAPIFDQVYSLYSLNEGTRFNNIPGDRGGPTKGGLTLQTYQNIIKRDNPSASLPTEKDLKQLSATEIKKITKDEFYIRPGINKLPETIQGTVFDMAVNAGPRNAIRILQMVISPDIEYDGRIGDETLNALESALQDSDTDIIDILQGYNNGRRIHYLDIIERNPSQKQFETSWMNRVNRFEVY